MADILPKLKFFIFLSVMTLFINLAIFITKMVSTPNSIDVLGLIGCIGGAFIPFTSLIGLISTGFPPEAIAFFALIIGIASGLQIWMLTIIVANYIPFIDI